MKNFYLRFLPLVLFILIDKTGLANAHFKSFKTERNIHEKSNKALVLWEHYISNSIDSLRILGTELYRASRIGKSNYGMAVSKKILGCYDVRTGKIKRGIRLLNASKNYFLGQNDFEMICESMNELGIAYFLQGDLETAESFFKASMKYGEESPVETNRFLAEVNLAKVYYEKNEIAKAKYSINHYIKKALSAKKFEATSNAFSLLGEMALSLNRLKTAQVYFDKQLFYAKKSWNSAYITRALNNHAISAYYNNQKNRSILLFNKVLKRRKTENFPFNTYEAYFNLASCYYPDQLEISLKYVDSCWLLAKNHQLKKQELEIYQWRFQHYKDLKNKQLIDSMKLVIQSLEKQNEQVRNELNQDIDRRSDSISTTYQLNWLFAILISVLAVRYFFRKGV